MTVIEKYKLQKKQILLGDISLDVFQTDDLDALADVISPDEFAVDERFPYFLKIWDSGYYLAKFFAEEFGINNIKDKKIIELGSGSGIVGLVLLHCGGIVTFTDYEKEALELCCANAEFNQISNAEAILADWRDFPDICSGVDMIVAADIFYEKRFYEPLLELTQNIINAGATFIVSDPGRGYCSTYIDQMASLGYKTELLTQYKNDVTSLRNIKIFMVSK